MNFTDEGLRLIKEFEGCNLHAYQDQRGIWTIGYGCTHSVVPGMIISEEDAIQRLENDVTNTIMAVAGMVLVPITDNQFSALVCLTYNIGCGNLSKSTLLNLINRNEFQQASEQFLVWDKVNGEPNAGLLRRRQAEKDLFSN